MNEQHVLDHFEIGSTHSGAFNGGWLATSGPTHDSVNPSTGAVIATVTGATLEDYDAVADAAAGIFDDWRMIPAPARGEYVRQIGNALRENKEPLGRLVSLEMGKILPEGLGEVQEMIDICDFAVGLSRQLYGLTMASERPAPSHVRAVAPAGSRRRDLGVQLSSCGLVVERRHRRSLRGPRGLETL